MGGRVDLGTQSFDSLWIWDEIDNALPWYRKVSVNKMPAKYLICRRVPCNLDLEVSSEEELWKEHERLTGIFLEAWKKIRTGEARLNELPEAKLSLLDLSVELANRMLTHCNLCRWNCRVDRSNGTKYGTCQLGSQSRVGSYSHHRGEELVFRGTRGSGTIFFNSCSWRCSFCQNSDISHEKDSGLLVTSSQLSWMAWQLRMEGCHNINWVGGEPTIHLHTILEAISLLDRKKPDSKQLAYLEQVKSDGFLLHRGSVENASYEGEFNVPMLWNSNFYMSMETMRLLRCLMDVWLPDFKFGSDKCSIKLARTPFMWETVTRNHKLVNDWREDVVIRHLIMPNHVECCTKPVLEWIAENTPNALVNLMDQFRPEYACNPALSTYDPRYEEIARYPSDEEIEESYQYARKLGLRFEAVTFEKRVSTRLHSSARSVPKQV